MFTKHTITSRSRSKRVIPLKKASKAGEDLVSSAKKRRKAQPIIREMSIDDLPSVFHLGESLFTSAFSPPLYRTWDEFEVTGLYDNDPELCLVAELDGKTVGFMMGTTVEKHGTAWKYGYVVWMGVKEEQQKRGIATKLYKEMEGRMRERGARMIIADTDESNERAINFFQKMGFVKDRNHVWLSKNVTGKHRRRKLATDSKTSDNTNKNDK